MFKFVYKKLCKMFGLNEIDSMGQFQVFPVLIIVGIILYGASRLGYGIYNANDMSKCRVKSIGDVLIVPSYALGCQIGKDRFNVRLN